MHSLEKVLKQHEKSWYTSQGVGINALKSVIPKLNLEAECDVKYTYHSLRATSATRMFSGGVPEKLITDRTGHHSLQSLRYYERPQPSVEKAIDKVTKNPAESVFTESYLRYDHGTSTATAYATPSLTNNKQTLRSLSIVNTSYTTLPGM